MMGVAGAEDCLQKPDLEQLWVIPAHKNLIGANLELVEAERREFRLRDALAPLRERFPFIVLDCPPALDLLTLNALVAADAVLIPMQAEYFALEGVSELLDTVERIRQTFNPQLEIEGVVLTMFDDRTNLAQQVAAELKKYFGDKLCSTSIPRNIRVAEAPSHGKPVLQYDVRSRGAESYIRLAKEVMELEVRRRTEIEAPGQGIAAPAGPDAAPATPQDAGASAAPDTASQVSTCATDDLAQPAAPIEAPSNAPSCLDPDSPVIAAPDSSSAADPAIASAETGVDDAALRPESSIDPSPAVQTWTPPVPESPPAHAVFSDEDDVLVCELALARANQESNPLAV
jgi:chromosome partitioning protein